MAGERACLALAFANGDAHGAEVRRKVIFSEMKKNKEEKSGVRKKG